MRSVPMLLRRDGAAGSVDADGIGAGKCDVP